MFGTHPVFKQIQATFKSKLLNAQKLYDEEVARIDKRHAEEVRNLRQKIASEKEVVADNIANNFFGSLVS